MQVIRCARLALPLDLGRVQQEVTALPDAWKLHFQKAHYEGAWSALPLRSLGGRLDAQLPFALGDAVAEYAATPLLPACPAIVEFLGRLACDLRSVRLMKLEAGAIIKPHCDADLSFEQGEARLHVPVFTNPDLEFLIENQRVVMEEGSCWYINANLSHAVANRGRTDRVHLVIDTAVNDWLREQFARAEVQHSIVRRPAAQLRQMIESFRQMNTPAAARLIPALEEELRHAE